MTKPKFRFQKPIIKSKTQPESKDVLWYFSQQKKGLTINTIKEYIQGQGWVNLFDTAPIEIEEVVFTENGEYENLNIGWSKVKVDVPINELTSATFTSNGQYTNPDGGWNNVTVDIPLNSIVITESGSYNASEGGWNEVNVDIPLNSITITENGSYNASIGGWNAIDVNIPREYPPNNEIWYTSINNVICNIANIPSEYTLISNTYSEGKGIFTFDKPITDLSGFVFSSEFFTTLTFPEGHVSGTFCTIFDCYNLNHYNIPEGIQDLPIQTQSIEYIKLPSSFSQFDINCTIWSNYKKLEVNHNNTKFLDFNCNALLQETSLGITLLTGSDNTIIPDIVTTIGDKAFKGKNIENLYIPDSVNTIGSYAFSDNVNLKSIRIGKNVQIIGTDIFKNCANIEYVKWDSETTNFIISTDSEYIFESSKSNIKNLIFGDNTTHIPDIFKDLTALKTIIIPENIISIGDNAFSSLEGLNSVVWNAEQCADFYYGLSPFYDLEDSIYTFTFGNKVKYIPDFLCHNLDQLYSIRIPDSVTHIGESSFSGCSQLKYIKIGSGVKTIDKNAFGGCVDLQEVVLPNVTSVRRGAFQGCTSLNSIQCQGVISLGSDVFTDCIGLQSISLPNVSHLTSYLFCGCHSLQSVVMPRANIIDKYTFYQCRSLQHINMPSSMQWIKEYAFEECTALQTITCRATTPPTLAANNKLSSITDVYVPSGSIEQYKTATNWVYYANKIKPITN